MLTLSEKLLLLGLHDEKGSVVFSASTALPFGLAGALLLELYFLKRIDFVEKKVHVINPAETDNELLNETLDLLRSSSSINDAKHWVNTIYRKVKNIQQRLAEQLVQKQILREQEHSFMWIINYSRYPTQDEKPEQDLRSRIKDIVIKQSIANEEELTLLHLIHACELIPEIFSKEERKSAKKRIEELIAEQNLGDAISKTIQEFTAAITMLIVTTAVATTVVT